jgi:hypothetical protein
MKRISALSLILTVAISLTSCLNGLDDDFIECGQDIGYITTNNGIKCAATSYGHITSPEIKNLKTGECYIMGYQITEASVDGIYNAKRVFNISENPLPQSAITIGKPADSTSVAISDLFIPFYSSSEYIEDRWVFNYVASVKNNEKITAEFYFNKDNQIDKDGVNIKGQNKIIIDIYFRRNGSPDTTSVAKLKGFTYVGNLRELRSFAFNPEYSKEVSKGTNGGIYKILLIQFRYHKYVSATKSEIAYLGSWENSYTQKSYFMVQNFYAD